MDPIALFIPEALEKVPLALWFTPPKAGVFDEKFPPNFFEHHVARVAPEAARAIVLPNNFLSTDERTAAYIEKYAALGERLKIPVFIFSIGDFTDHIRFDPRVYVLTFSVYAGTMRPRDIVIPTLTEDNAAGGIVLREKGQKPLVSFCGMGGFSSSRAWAAYAAKTTLCLLQSLIEPRAAARAVGVYWRRRAMRACERSPLVDTHFIVRRSFSGSRKTIELDPAQARREYLDSVVDSDFVIAPKGDGNYSNRFLKALCMGRIPVLVDTDVVLPLEDRIDYSKIIVRVPMREVSNTPEYMRAFYDGLSAEEWKRRQTLAREAFEKYLRQDSFFYYFFTEVLPTLS